MPKGAVKEAPLHYQRCSLRRRNWSAEGASDAKADVVGEDRQNVWRAPGGRDFDRKVLEQIGGRLHVLRVDQGVS